jgi:membrane-associated phospholipid phosphatase
LAYVISQVGSPPVLVLTAIVLSASGIASAQAWLWAGVHGLLAVLVPFAYLVWLVRQGGVTDLDVQLREQRMRPLVFALGCTCLGWLVMAIGGAPSQMAILAGALSLQTTLIFAITLRWKISVHSAAAAATATLAWSLIGTPLPLLIGVPIVAWSRVRLQRHSVAQTVAGASLGATTNLAMLAVMGAG